MIREIKKENKVVRINTKKTFFLWLIIVFVFLPFATICAFLLAFNNRVYPQISLCGTTLGGKNQTEVKKITQSLIKRNSPVEIVLSDNENKISLEIKSLFYPETETTKKVLDTGRGKNLIGNFSEIIFIFRKRADLPLVFYYDQNELSDKIEEISTNLSQTPQNPEIRIVETSGKKNVILNKGRSGQEVDKKVLERLILEKLSCPKSTITIPIPFILKIPAIPDEIAEKTRERATLFLNKEIKLMFNDRTWEINDEEVINLLSFYGNFDEQKIASFSSSLAKVINAPPENPVFNFENNRVVVFKPAKDGVILKEAEFSQTLEIKLQQVETNQESQIIQIPVIKIPPKITTADSNSLGIKELLGKGSSDYSGSIGERVHNLTLSTSRLNGILVPPKEEFSFLKALGEVNQSTGYKQAYIIKEGKTILGDGGGVCQVSTTLFRAALNSGLLITERHAHAYRVSYYEKDLGPGFDATVFEPSIDLKFINNTPNYILIQSSINKNAQKIIFEIYGTADDRKVTISPVRLYDRQPPPPDLYQDDPTLPLGKIKQTEHRIWGAKAAFDYKVTKEDEVLDEKTFYSNYRPWQAVYLRGTGR